MLFADGLMGFSQGGSLALQIVALQQLRLSTEEGDAPRLRFLWIQSSRLPRDPSCKGLFDAPIELPCFVNHAEDDTAVRPEETRALIARLQAPTVSCLPGGGHSLMSISHNPEAGEKLRFFLQAQQ